MDKQTSRMLFSVYSWERRAQRREASLVNPSVTKLPNMGRKKKKLLPLYRRAKNISSKVSMSSFLPV